MSSSSPPGQNSENPPLHTTQSFPRMGSPERSLRARRAQSTTISDTDAPLSIPGNVEVHDGDNSPDLFERRRSTDSEVGGGEQHRDEGSVLSQNVQELAEELPIELMSLTDRYGRLG